MELESNIVKRMFGGLWGAVVGDALGVPVEFQTRIEVRFKPVLGMRSNGTFNLPAGSWSDDSSLLLCTVESLISGYDLTDMAKRFIRWKTKGHWTPYGTAFDIGNSTAAAINRLQKGAPYYEAGGTTVRDNGNGSLMRILPVALYYQSMDPEDFSDYVHEVSSITHRHPRSQLACAIYCTMAWFLLNGYSPEDAYGETITLIPIIYEKHRFWKELLNFSRILGGYVQTLPEDSIRSSGYVVDTLEASLWCLLNTDNYEKAVLKAVNLGDDTDTTGCVTGGLAGLVYSKTSIPGGWLNAIARRDEIDELFCRFVNGVKIVIDPDEHPIL